MTTAMLLVQLDVEGRPYLVYLTSSYGSNTPAGVIFPYHGRGKNMSHQQDLSQFSNENWNPYMLSICPQGINVCVISFWSIAQAARGFQLT